TLKHGNLLVELIHTHTLPLTHTTTHTHYHSHTHAHTHTHIHTHTHEYCMYPPMQNVFSLCLSLQCDENTTFTNQGLYLSMPCCRADLSSCPTIPASFPFQRSSKESFYITTLLASTN